METGRTNAAGLAQGFTFRPLEMADPPTLHEWLARPH